MTAERIVVRGHVQGVGFRPTVAGLAMAMQLPGWVRNDEQGVEIVLGGERAVRDGFVTALLSGLPPLARVDELVRTPVDLAVGPGFAIVESAAAGAAEPRAVVVPDAGVCAACAAEVRDPHGRRYRYPFTNCTHCGPRFSIALEVPWDRAHTTMRAFPRCADCAAEYADPADRRFHAEPIACYACGPRLTLTRSDGRPFVLETMTMLDAADAVTTLLQRGEIVALKGLGGFHLLADATSPQVVARLRQRKHRPDKPFALMVRDLGVAEQWFELSTAERAALSQPAAPIVLVAARPPSGGARRELAPEVARQPADAVVRHGVMLPSTPLHLLALLRCARPVICTSGNRSDEPQVIDDAQATARLGDIADWILGHDRVIHNRVDDSVVRVFGGRARVLRRARGLAPAPLPLPPGFAEVAASVRVLAAGADLKASVCLSRAGDLVLSQHLGDLDDALTRLAYVEQRDRLGALHHHRPTVVAVDNHPESRARALALEHADELGLPLEEVSHHHAHFAACLGEHGVALGAPPLLGIVLDGLGAGEPPGSLWGGEVLLGGYARSERVGTLKPVALLGGDRAAREPWRCLYAQLRAELSWGELLTSFGDVPVLHALRAKPVDLLEQMLRTGTGAPRASSCGRLFDAVAAALGLCFEAQTYEAQAASALESLVTPEHLARALAEREQDEVYPLPSPTLAGEHLPYLEPRDLWRAVLGDLAVGTAPGLIAARFHVALAVGYARLADRAARRHLAAGRPLDRRVALSGGCLSNAVLAERLTAELEVLGYQALTHAVVPAGDGGLSFGQALVVLARAAEKES